MQKNIRILDNEFRLRSFVKPLTIKQSHRIGRFDELTHFFNAIYGLFHHPTFTFGVNTFMITNPWTQLSNINLGFNLHLDPSNAKHQQINLLRNITLFALIHRREQQDSFPMALLRFHSFDQNLQFAINHRWTSSMTSTFLFATQPQRKCFSSFEYQQNHATLEFKCEYFFSHVSNIQINYLLRLWPGNTYQIDAGFDCRIGRKETSIELALRLRRSSDSFIFKTNLSHPIENYLIGFQRSINNLMTIGLLAEKRLNLSPDYPSIRVSAMSRWSIDRFHLDINTLINSDNEIGCGLIKYVRSIPMFFQIFALYSYRYDQYKWGLGLQMQI